MTGWGELYDGWEKDIPSQYEHRGPSLAEAQVERWNYVELGGLIPSDTRYPESWQLQGINVMNCLVVTGCHQFGIFPY